MNIFKKFIFGLIFCLSSLSFADVYLYGNIEVTKYRQRLDDGKKIKINQNGRTPKFTQ